MAYIKAIKSGNLIEHWTFEREPSPQRLKKRAPRAPRVASTERRPDAIAACKKAFRRLVRANLDPKSPPALLTLTMRDIVSVSEAYKAFTLFGKRLRTMYGSDISYIAVPEFQKRGAVHFHILMFGLKDEDISNERKTRRIAELWGYGFVDILSTDGSPKLASYLAKYMSKAMHDHRLVGKRAYSASRNVLRPVLANTPLMLAFCLNSWGVGVDNSVAMQKEYDTLFLGRCIYKQFIVE